MKKMKIIKNLAFGLLGLGVASATIPFVVSCGSEDNDDSYVGNGNHDSDNNHEDLSIYSKNYQSSLEGYVKEMGSEFTKGNIKYKIEIVDSRYVVKAVGIISKTDPIVFLDSQSLDKPILEGYNYSLGDYKIYLDEIGDNFVNLGNSLEELNFGDQSNNFAIPNSVYKIGRSAFSNLGLKKIIIPDSVVRIGRWAFGNSGLTSVSIPNSITEIADGTFGSCTNLTSVSLPNTLKTIGDRAFDFCKSLTSITIPNSVEEIGWEAFARCFNLTQVNFGNSVKTINSSAFRYCSDLTSITIPNSVEEIGAGAFGDCTGLTQVNLGNSVKTVRGSAFENCTALTQVNLGNSVQTIEYEAFMNCSLLRTITIPDSVREIQYAAFKDCINLISITFPNQRIEFPFREFADPILENTRVVEVTINKQCKVSPNTFDNKNASGGKIRVNYYKS